MKLDKPLYSGKIRELYDIGRFNNIDALLLVSTDRISCFDVVLPTAIPDKGKILNTMSNFWFDHMRDVVGNHLLSTDLKEIEEIPKNFIERSVIVKKAKRLNVECIVRGYLAGSALKEYLKQGTVGGVKMPKGLKESGRLPEVLFTPSTKESLGKHDINISFDELAVRISPETAQKIKKLSLTIYEKARQYAESKNIIIADTKFEFGFHDGEIILIDEVLTPDSSRFWDKNVYEPGKPQKNFDKQFVRDYLISIEWEKLPQVPELPSDIVQKTRERYLEVQNRLCEAQ